MNLKTRIAIICAVVLCAAGILWIAGTSKGSPTMLSYSQFLDEVRTGQIASVVVISDRSGAAQAICRMKDGNSVRTVLPSDYRDALAAMQSQKVDVEFPDSAGALLVKAAPFLVLLGVWVILMIGKFPNGRGRISWLASPGN